MRHKNLKSVLTCNSLPSWENWCWWARWCRGNRRGWWNLCRQRRWWGWRWWRGWWNWYRALSSFTHFFRWSVALIRVPWVWSGVN